MMKSQKRIAFIIAAVFFVNLLIILKPAANVYARDIDGTWKLEAVSIDDDISLASDIGMSGYAIISGSIISIDVTGMDEPVFAFLSETGAEGVYSIGAGDISVGYCGLSDDVLIVLLEDNMSLVFESESSDGFGSISNSYSDPYSDSYKSGTYIVGDDIPAGEYVFFADRGTSGYFCVYESKYSSDIKENSLFDYNSIMHINSGEKIVLERCCAVPISDAKVDTDGEGMFKIGTHLSAGNYHVKATSDEDGYYCIYSDNEQNDIRDNDLFEGDAYFSVRSGEYLVLERCRIVK